MPSLVELSDPGYSWWDLYNVSNFYHSLGHDVFILSMPLKGINLGPGTTDKNLISDHWWFLQWEEKGDHPLRYFLEPAYLTMNYAKAQGYGDVCTRPLDALPCRARPTACPPLLTPARGTDMAGLSGGGWSTTFASAIDKRIKGSFPIAGSVPCAMRNPLGIFPGQEWTGDDDEDYEQSCMPTTVKPGKSRDQKPGRSAFNACNYTCQYLLAGLEPERFQVQILHE